MDTVIFGSIYLEHEKHLLSLYNKGIEKELIKRARFPFW
jgi:hypothetical protein